MLGYSELRIAVTPGFIPYTAQAAVRNSDANRESVATSNLERAVAFYRDGLGLPRQGDSGVAFFRLRGLWLGTLSP